MSPTTTESQKIQQLLLFIHKKSDVGYRGFVRAIEQESSHLGHRELYAILTNCKPSEVITITCIISSHGCTIVIGKRRVVNVGLL